MKKQLHLLAIISLVLCSTKLFSQSFTSGNIVVLRVGDSSTTLAATGNTLAIDEFTTSGTYVGSLILPKTGTSAICLGATATSEGALSLASDQNSINFFAYKTAAPYSGTVNSSTSTALNRVVVSINSSGTVSLPTLTASKFSAGNPRAVVSDGSNYWGVGSNTGICWGNSSSNIDTVVSTSSTNIRVINIFGAQMYYSTGSGTIGIWRAGTGTPTNSGNTSTPYLSTAGTGTGSASPYGFAMNNDSTICYVADDRTITNGGGIQKWTRSGSTWTLAYTLKTGTGSTVGARGLAVDWNTTPPTIIATTTETLNRVIRINDSSSTVTAVTLATATTKTIFRGVSYTPGTSSLPVTYTSFNATKLNNSVKLNWVTASEINNDRFEIEKSLDNTNFIKIGEVKGQTNSHSAMNYSFVDGNLSKGISYYRLKQMDLDGDINYSKTVTLVNRSVTKTANTILPNPFSNELTIQVSSETSATAQIEIIDMLGKVHHSGSEQLSAGNNKISIITENLNNGIYFVRVNINGEITTQKIVKR